MAGRVGGIEGRSRSVSESTSSEYLDLSASFTSDKIKALRSAVDKNTEVVTRLLLSSKESLERRKAIETAFRVCRETFLEVSAACVGLLDCNDSSAANPSLSEIKEVIAGAVSEYCNSAHLQPVPVCDPVVASSPVAGGNRRSYASVVRSREPVVSIAGGHSLPVTRKISFVIEPRKEVSNKLYK